MNTECNVFFSQIKYKKYINLYRVSENIFSSALSVKYNIEKLWT